jgi:hypothetical protein
MSTECHLAPATPDPINVDQDQAARRCGLSAKTLERLANAGQPVGRFKVGRRVLFHVPTLDAWFRSRAEQARGAEK